MKRLKVVLEKHVKLKNNNFKLRYIIIMCVLHQQVRWRSQLQ